MKKQLCAFIVNFPGVTVLTLSGLAVFCLFSIPGTVCFLGVFCLIIQSIPKGQTEGRLQEQTSTQRRRPRRRSPSPDASIRHGGERSSHPSAASSGRR